MRAPVPVPCRWPGGTIVCVGSGPSLTPDDLTALRRHPTLTINDAVRLAPWAEIVYAPDARWWTWHGDVVSAYAADKYTLSAPVAATYPSVGLLRYRSCGGLSTDPSLLHTGGHSGFAAINLAAHLVGDGGVIILLGYDLQPAADGAHHFFGDHPDGSHVRYSQWLEMYATLLEPLAERHITIVNASRTTAITAIPRVSLETVR